MRLVKQVVKNYHILEFNEIGSLMKQNIMKRANIAYDTYDTYDKDTFLLIFTTF